MTTEKRPIQVDDLYKINSVEDPQISPDGQWVAFVRVTLDRLENSYKRNIWLWPTGGGDPRQLTRGGKDSRPRWSPDSKTLAFVSGRDERPQVYLLPVAAPGGEARALTSMQNGATGHSWSSDGTQIAFLASSTAEERAKADSGEEDKPPQDKLEGKHRKERREEDEKNRLDPYPMWRVPYRVGTSFLDERYAQVYVVAVDDEESKPRRLTDVDANHTPPEWSPDGNMLYTTRQIDPTADEPFVGSGVFRISVKSGENEQLTAPEYAAFSPLPSPDGQWLAYVRSPREGQGALEAISRLAVMPTAGGETRDLNLDLDRSVVDFVWSGGDSLVFIATDQGNGPVYRVPAGGGAVETIFEGRFEAEALDSAANGTAYTASTPLSPVELYWRGEPVTQFNREWLDEVIVQETHEMWFTSPSGERIQGWYILPVGYEEGQKYPLALNIHGGPRAMWGPSTASMFHEWQLHAASGYAVFYCNPRGADGYGEGFRRALHAAWGDVAFEDIMAGVDAVLEKGFIDESRMAVTGGSYGGYMTAWIVGHTDRFATAVSQRGVYNLVSFYGTSDVPILISNDFSVEPWEDHELLWKHSPLAYAQNIKTPLLLIHSENDYRVPIEQAEQLFAYVRRSGGTVKMLRYPRDGHELSRSGEPAHRVSRLTKMVEWFDQYCKS